MVAAVWHLAEPPTGPYPARDLRELARSGRLVRGSLVRKAGMDRWVAAERVLGLLDDRVVLPAVPGDGSPPGDPFAVTAVGEVLGDGGADAGFGLRLLAFGLDVLILVAIFAAGAGFEVYQQGGALLLDRSAGLLVSLLLLPAICYWPMWEGILGTTPGKWICGIRVVDLAGHPVGLLRAGARNGLRLIGVVTIVLTLIDHLCIACHPRRQALHDLLAGTRCVNPRRSGPGVTGAGNPTFDLVLDDVPFDAVADRRLQEALRTTSRARQIGWIWTMHGALLIGSSMFLIGCWALMWWLWRFLERVHDREIIELLAPVRWRIDRLLVIFVWLTPGMMVVGILVLIGGIGFLRRRRWSWWWLNLLGGAHLVGLLPLAAILAGITLRSGLHREISPGLGVAVFAFDGLLVLAGQILLVWLHRQLRSAPIRRWCAGADPPVAPAGGPEMRQ
jgi:uncharacterized RDD family membrane protein YckC